MSEKRQVENVLRGIARNAIAAHRRGEAAQRIAAKQQTGKTLVITRFAPLHERERQ